MMTALECCEQSGELVEALQSNVELLDKEAVIVRQQINACKAHGLGPSLAAPELLKKLVPTLKAIESLAQRGLEQIESAPIE